MAHKQLLSFDDLGKIFFLEDLLTSWHAHYFEKISHWRALLLLDYCLQLRDASVYLPMYLYLYDGLSSPHLQCLQTDEPTNISLGHGNKMHVMIYDILHDETEYQKLIKDIE